MAGKAVAVADTSVEGMFPALFGGDELNDAVALMREAVGGENIGIGDLERVKIPASGGQYWQLPDEPPTKEIVGVLTAYTTPRVFWDLGMNDPGRVEGAPPDCSSPDGKFGRPARINSDTGDLIGGMYGIGSELHPEGDCASCPMSKFYTAQHGKGKGQACNDTRQLFVLLPGSLLPVIVQLSATSIAPFRRYIVSLSSRTIPWYGVVTKIGLTQKPGPAGPYSVAKFERGDEMLTPDQADVMKNLGAYFMAQYNARADDTAAAATN